MDRSFWNGRRVLLTGHTGFKGAWLSLWLQSTGAQVRGYALEPPTRPSLFEIAFVERGMVSQLADVRDPVALREAMASFRPEVVLHLAAQTVVRTSYELPVDTFDTNVVGTARVLDAVRRAESVRAIVVVTSDKCYENRGWLWPYREDDTLGGHDPYSTSKACAELVTTSYLRSFFSGHSAADRAVGIATVRAGNVLGGGDWTKDQLVPDCIRAFMEGTPVRLRFPEAVRPWQFVLEPLNGYLTLAEHLCKDAAAFSGAWNFGPAEDDARTVSWIVEQLVSLWGEGARSETIPQDHPHEAGLLRLDSSKARSLLGWRPTLQLSDALDWTVNWYRAYQRGDDLRELTIDQIRRFESAESHR
jgi:CDP-glucose 4,6-dehydratase